MRGGPQGQQQRLFLLQARLHLTPDQQAAIKAAMTADEQARRNAMRQMFRNGGKPDPAAAAAANTNTLDSTLAKVLTPDQMTSYQQVQADEQASRADAAATAQLDQIAPLVQLSDSQKEQVSNALYQLQMTAPDPQSLMTNPNPEAAIAAQAQATQAALAKVLTPDQMALVQQEAQTVAAADPGGPGGFGGGRRGGGGGRGGGGRGGGGGGVGNGGGGGGGAAAGGD